MRKIYSHSERNMRYWVVGIFMLVMPFPILSQISRTQVVNNAAAFTTFSWIANSCNLWNGTYCGGANVYKAPWVTSTGSKTSMPYAWGGWSTTSEYNTAMSGCKSAGQVCSSSGGGCSGFPSVPLSCAGGHDCSGLVSRAWGLSSKYSTSTLPNISTSIPITSTQPGDILNDAGSHVRLVETNYGNGNYQVIEASGSDWKCAYHSYNTAQLSGYEPRCPDPDVVDGGCSINCVPPAQPTITFGGSSCPGTAGSNIYPPGTALTWNLVSGATGYKVYVSKYPYGTSCLISGYNPFPCGNYPGQIVMSAALEPGMLYRWSMNATSDCSNSACDSPVSVAKYFYVPPTISPSSNQYICEDEDVNFSTTPANVCSGGSVSYQWYRNGSAISGATGTSYTATQSGSYYVRFNFFGSTYCSSSSIQSSTVNVTVDPLPGQAGTITGSSSVCKSQNNVSYYVPVIANADTYHWTYSGSGANISGNSNNITINFSSSATSGNLTVKGDNDCGYGPVSPNFAITVNAAPISNAGTDATICQTSAHTLSGTASNYSSVTWSTSGDGTFSSASSLTAVYTPGPLDIANGTITLTLTAAALSPCTISASDTKVLAIQKNPVANAGNDATICQTGTHQLSGTAQNYSNVTWSTSGNGSFSSTSSLAAVYTPGSTDITAGSVSLTLTTNAVSPCTTAANDVMILTIQKSPTANAGTDASICQTSTHTLSGTANNYSGVLWSTSGNGTFSSTSSLTAVYTPGTSDINNGTVTLTLTASAISPCTIFATDTKVLTIQKTPMANAGADATICQSSTHSLSGAASNYLNVLWSTSGNGTFSSTSSLNPVYNPGTTDITNGSVTLSLTASSISPCTGSATDQKVLTIQKSPTANAGSDATISQTGTHTLAGTAANYATIFWTTSGNGTFSSASSLTPVYTPGTADISTGAVTLTLTASASSPCTVNAVDAMTLTISTTATDQIVLKSGWNLISLDVIPIPSTPEYVFAPLINSNNLEIVTGFLNQQGVMFDPDGLPFLNSLQYLVTGEGYWVKVINDATLNVAGAPIPENQTINLKAGWNLIGYWLPGTTTPEEAFAALITAGVLEIVTGYNQGGQMFDPDGLPFLNTLTEIKNGFGYWVKLNADYNGFSFPLPWDCGDLLFDERDGKTYETLQIGTQCWMKQNLNIGTRIAGANNQTNNETIEKYCYNNLETNCDVYGGLYQWDEMMQYSIAASAQGICPSNWHLPSDTEWTASTTFVGNQPAFLCNGDTTWIAKSLASTTNWNYDAGTCTVGNNPSTNNASGFTGIPAGTRYLDGSFYSLGNYGSFWSSSQYQTDNSEGNYLTYDYEFLMRGPSPTTIGISVRCLKNQGNQTDLPSITTSEISSFTSISANTGGDVTADGGVPVTSRGVCWSTSQNPTLANNYTSNGTGPGAFTCTLTGLTQGPTYYVRAYATNSVGTAYGNEVSVTTLPIQCPNSFTDSRDGKVYTTVIIKNQCWMKENLNVGIPVNGTGNQTNNGIIEKYCYDNQETNCDIYGGLYQWNEMMQYSTIAGVQGICPDGWYLPTDAGWTKLTNFVSSQPEYLCNSNTNFIAKSLAATTNWNTYTDDCTIGNNISTNNATGLSSLPGGYRANDGSFDRLGEIDFLWSSTMFSSSDAWNRNMSYYSANVWRYYSSMSSGFSVRCIKDQLSQNSLPIVTTSTVSAITSTSAISGGIVTSDGGTTVTARGVCWSTMQNPNIANSLTTNGTGSGTFTSNLTGLYPNTNYYIRAYATNSEGTAYGNQLSFTTLAQQCPDSFTDSRDGTEYSAVQIGSQCWMKQNLNIGSRVDGTSNQTNNGTIEKYCYDNLETNCDVYGGLYQWDEMMQYTTITGVQGICPDGWHLPTDTEWTLLTNRT